jgi:hypothetical protein
MEKSESISDELKIISNKKRRCTCRIVFLTFILVFCGTCLLSMLAHSFVAQSDTPTEGAAEICIGEIYSDGDPGPLKRQGLSISSPTLPYFIGSPLRSFTTHKMICGIIPWSPKDPYFTKIVIRPFGVYSPQ